MGALFVGSCVARSLAYAWQCPFIPVHHMEAHLLIPLLDLPDLKPPFAALLVSGGHSQFYKVSDIGDYTLVGETLDDAAGEAFDKLAKMLGLEYPGGPAVARLAEQGTARFPLPRPMCDRPGYDLSFSGLKTAARNLIESLRSNETLDEAIPDICASFQAAVVDCLVRKSTRVLKDHHLKQLVVAGGVSANLHLRSTMAALAAKKSWSIDYPRLAWCTDNGVMVAYAGLHKYARSEFSHDHAEPLGVKARWSLSKS